VAVQGKRTDRNPDEFAHFLVQGGEMEEVAEDGGVDDLHADVAVKQGCDQSGDEGDGVAECLPVVSRVRDACNGCQRLEVKGGLSSLTLVRDSICELALGRVDDHAHEQVAAVDENLGADETLPEVHAA